MSKTSWIASILAVLPTACASPEYAKGDWPRELPPQSYYARVYEDDARNRNVQPPEQYFTWVVRYYEGYGLAPGWLKNQSTLSSDLGTDEYVLLVPKLSHLAQITSAEWAKHNDVRRIDTQMLTLWGKMLRKAHDAHRLDEAVDRLLSDVRAIVAGRLDAAAITPDRYHDLLALR